VNEMPVTAAVVFSAGGDGGRRPGLGRMAKAKSIGWAIYVAGFVIWLFGYLSTGHAPLFDWKAATRGGFLASFRISKQNSDLRSCLRAWSRLCLGLAYSPSRSF